jgi:hypothetical protein
MREEAAMKSDLPETPRGSRGSIRSRSYSPTAARITLMRPDFLSSIFSGFNLLKLTPLGDGAFMADQDIAILQRV